MSLSQSSTDKRRVVIALNLNDARALLAGNHAGCRTALWAEIERELAVEAQRCPECLSPPGARHYCRHHNEFVEAGIK